MGLQCVVTNPSSIQAIDGDVFLNITGGTPPYNVMWDNNNTSPFLMNLPLGSYTATVVDNFKDYKITIHKNSFQIYKVFYKLILT